MAVKRRTPTNTSEVPKKDELAGVAEAQVEQLQKGFKTAIKKLARGFEILGDAEWEEPDWNKPCEEWTGLPRLVFRWLQAERAMEELRYRGHFPGRPTYCGDCAKKETGSSMVPEGFVSHLCERCWASKVAVKHAAMLIGWRPVGKEEDLFEDV